MNWVVDHHVAQIVSDSYGDLRRSSIPADQVGAETAIFIQAACEGIGVYFSSGDNGDESRHARLQHGRLAGVEPLGHRRGRHLARCRRRATTTCSRPAGARARACSRRRLDARPARQLDLRQRRRHEPALWASPGISSGSCQVDQPVLLVTNRGGRCPTWPWTATHDRHARSARRRPSRTAVYYDTYRIGGTSVSCPLFAGMMALADQRAGYPHGFAEPGCSTRLAGSQRLPRHRQPARQRSRPCAATSDGVNAADGVDLLGAHHEPDRSLSRRSPATTT